MLAALSSTMTEYRPYNHFIHKPSADSMDLLEIATKKRLFLSILEALLKYFHN